MGDSSDSSAEMRQWWYGEEFVMEYISTVEFKGPFRSVPNEESVSFESHDSLCWSDLPGTNGRYRAALMRTKTMSNSGDYAVIRICVKQRHDMGISPTSMGIDAFVQISGQSSLKGEIFGCEPKSVWKFSSPPRSYHYGQEMYCVGDIEISLSERYYGPASPDEIITLALTFQITEPAKEDEDATKFPINIMMAMARNLTSPGNHDLELPCQNEHGEDKILYAQAQILGDRSEYYATKIGFDNRKCASDDVPGEVTNCTARLPKPDPDEDFDLLHNVLYYLYTDRIAFSTNPERQPLANLPKFCPAEDIYMMADRMMLGELKKKAFEFLKLSCTVENIVSRFTSKFAELHDEVSTVYSQFFRKNWDRIKETKDFDQALPNTKGDLGEILRVFIKFRDMMKEAVFIDSREM